MMKAVLITNIPAPYRVLQFDDIAASNQIDFTVFYCNKIEFNRKWKVPNLKHNHIFLKQSSLQYKNKTIYFNFDIWRQLKNLNPDIIITNGFYPTMLIAMLYIKLYRKKHIVFSDGWALTDKNLTVFHRLLRRIFYRKASACLAIGIKSRLNYLSYGAKEDGIFYCPIIINNEKFSNYVNKEKTYDLMFSGQFIERKMPFFFLNVAHRLSKIINDLGILIVGSGPLEKSILHFLIEYKLKYDYPGFVDQDYLPEYYAKSKLLLFPTSEDPWGVVANEACAAGTPVITCENAGSAGDLIVHNFNGLVLPLDEKIWAHEISKLLKDEIRISNYSKNCIERIKNYNRKEAAEQFISAVRFASNQM